MNQRELDRLIANWLAAEAVPGGRPGWGGSVPPFPGSGELCLHGPPGCPPPPPAPVPPSPVPSLVPRPSAAPAEWETGCTPGAAESPLPSGSAHLWENAFHHRTPRSRAPASVCSAALCKMVPWGGTRCPWAWVCGIHRRGGAGRGVGIPAAPRRWQASEGQLHPEPGVAGPARKVSEPQESVVGPARRSPCGQPRGEA